MRIHEKNDSLQGFAPGQIPDPGSMANGAAGGSWPDCALPMTAFHPFPNGSTSACRPDESRHQMIRPTAPTRRTIATRPQLPPRDTAKTMAALATAPRGQSRREYCAQTTSG